MNNQVTGGSIAAIIIAAVIAIVLKIFIAKKFEEVAIKKGHPDVHAFAWCFWLDTVGYIYVAALPYMTEKSIKSIKPKSDTYNRYACKSITKTDKITSARCFACNEYHSSIPFCKIEKDGSVTEFPVCDKCFEQYSKNSKNN